MSPKEKESFFNTLALEMGVISLADAKRFYYAFIRLAVRTTNQTGQFEMPDLGKFKITGWGGRVRNTSGLNGAKSSVISTPVAARIMRFTPDYKLKKHINRQA